MIDIDNSVFIEESMNTIPLVKNKKNLFIRAENENKYSINIPNALVPKYEIINETMYEIISYIDDKRSITDLLNLMIKKYGDENRTLISKDLSQALMLLWVKGIIAWKDDIYPQIDKLSIQLDSISTISVAFDEDIKDIIDYLNSINKERDIYYKNIFDPNSETRAIFIRNSIFNMNIIYFMLKEMGKIVGVISVQVPINTNSTVAIFDIISIKKTKLNEVLKSIQNIFNSVSIVECTKIRLPIYPKNNLFVEVDGLSEILTYETCLKREIKELDVDMYCMEL